MLVKKIVLTSLLLLLAFAVPAASVRMVNVSAPILQADGTWPEPPPVPLPGGTMGVSAPILQADGGDPPAPPLPLPGSAMAA